MNHTSPPPDRYKSDARPIINAIDWALEILIEREQNTDYVIEENIPQGMSNKTYLIKFSKPNSSYQSQYLLRIPLPQSSFTIDRKTEAHTCQIIANWDKAEQIIAFHRKKGWKLSIYKTAIRPINARNPQEYITAIKTMVELHEKNFQHPITLNLSDTILKYYQIIKNIAYLKSDLNLENPETLKEIMADFINRFSLPLSLQDFIKLHENAMMLLKWCESLPREMLLCHLDMHCENMLIDSDGEVTVIDWEYAANQDADLDLVMHLLYSEANSTEVEWAIDKYFELRNKECPKWHRLKIYAYMAVVAYMWMIWGASSNIEESRLQKYVQGQFRLCQKYLKIALEEEAELAKYRVDNAVILAAGTSSRFVPISLETPKGLATFKGEILIERQIQQLQEAGITDIYVITGYRHELFEYLKEEYGVSLRHNPYYDSRNNIFSLQQVLNELGNTYICSADNYFTENVFEPYVTHPYYSVLSTREPLAEWFVKTDNSLITGVEIASSDAPLTGDYMCGHVYFDRETSVKMKELIQTAVLDEEKWGYLWEKLYLENIDEIAIYARKYSVDTIKEFDSVDDILREDPDFLVKTKLPIIGKLVSFLTQQGAEKPIDLKSIHSFTPYNDPGKPNRAIGCDFIYRGKKYRYLND